MIKVVFDVAFIESMCYMQKSLPIYKYISAQPTSKMNK